MDWLIENWGLVLALVTIVVVGVVFLYLRYKGNQDRLYADLEVILGQGLDFLKGWAGDCLEDVSQEDVHDVADLFYDKYVAGTAVGGIVTRGYVREMLWKRFCQWRDWFISFNYALVR